MVRRVLARSYKTARRIVVAVVGTTLVLLGLAMLVLPGPAIVVIPAGLAILALEFEWARRWLRAVRDPSALTREPRSESDRLSPDRERR